MPQQIPPTYYRNQWGQVVPLNSPPPLPYLPPIPEPQPLTESPQAPIAKSDAPKEAFAFLDAALSARPDSASAEPLPGSAGFLGGRSFSSDIEIAPPPGVSTPEEPARPRRRKHTQRRRSRKSHSPHETDRERHQRLCAVCSHRDREFIEEEFLHWHNPDDIGHAYKVGYRSICRHAHAMGLFARRDANLRFALAGIIEHAHNVEPSADSVIRAVRAYSRVNSAGEWIDPPARVIVSSGGRFLDPQPLTQTMTQALAPTRTLDLQPAPQAPLLPVNENKIENDATH